jgi:hypothetical protein
VAVVAAEPGVLIPAEVLALRDKAIMVGLESQGHRWVQPAVEVAQVQQAGILLHLIQEQAESVYSLV